MRLDIPDPCQEVRVRFTASSFLSIHSSLQLLISGDDGCGVQLLDALVIPTDNGTCMEFEVSFPPLLGQAMTLRWVSLSNKPWLWEEFAEGGPSSDASSHGLSGFPPGVPPKPDTRP